MIDIFAPYCELVSDRGTRGRVGGTSVAIKKYNVILMSRLFWNLHLNYLFKGTTVKTCLLLPATPCVTLPALPQPGSHALSIISAHVAGTWKDQIHQEICDMRPPFQFPRVLFQLFPVMWLCFMILLYPSSAQNTSEETPGRHSFDHRMWSSWPGSRTAIICKQIWQHAKTKETTRWVIGVKPIIYLDPDPDKGSREYQRHSLVWTMNKFNSIFFSIFLFWF